MKGKKTRAAVVAVISSVILSLSACGKEPDIFEVDYEGGDTTESSFDSMKSDIEDQFNVDIEVEPKYKIKLIDEKSIKEDEIVKNFFGNTAKPLCENDKITYTEADAGNPIYERIYNVHTKSGTSTEVSQSGRYDSWVDGESFFTHVYEGTYRKADYLLLIGYSKTEHEMYAALYPKCPGAVVGDESLDQMSYSHSNGTVVAGHAEKSKYINLSNLNIENGSVSSDDELARMINDTLTEKLEIGIKGNDIVFESYDHMYMEMSGEENSDVKQKGEVLFYNNDILDDPQYSGIIRNGYAASLAGDLYRLAIMSDYDFGGYSEKYGGYNIYYGTYDMGIDDMFILVDDEGVFAFNVSFRYSVLETIYDEERTFDDAIIFESAGIDPTQEMDEEAMRKLESIMMRMVYYYKKSDEVEGEGMLVPALVYTVNNECIILDANTGELIDRQFFMD